MNVKIAYDNWSEIYDSNKNKTRDLEAETIRKLLKNQKYSSCLEIGCGTGKNTDFLISISENVRSVDFSEKMIEVAKRKFSNSSKVNFQIFDITNKWQFIEKYDLISISLVLEHIKNLDHIFAMLNMFLTEQGKIYLGELHPFKQYSGTKARYKENNEIKEIEAYTHNFSEYFELAQRYGFKIAELKEDYAEGDEIPRILAFILERI